MWDLTKWNVVQNETAMSAPRCLADFAVTVAEDPGVFLDTLVDESRENRFFAIACRCGGPAFAVRSVLVPHFYLTNRVAYGPVSLRCTACGQEHVCFDPTKHGYDVEIDHFPSTGPYEGEVEDFACPACSATAFGATARFEYFEAADADRTPDMFGFFTLIGTCRSCETKTTIATQECA